MDPSVTPPPPPPGLIAGVEVISAIFFVLVLSTLWPQLRILHRTGLSRWWFLLAFIPIVNLIAIWVLAYVRWPIDDK